MASVDDFVYWQEKALFHPLTCGNDSNHSLLVPSEADVDGGVLLTCPDCDYKQVPFPSLHEIAVNGRAQDEYMQNLYKKEG